MKTPVVDIGSCILCEICIEVAPDVFQINDAGFVEVQILDQYIDGNVEEAIKHCPKDCISWE